MHGRFTIGFFVTLAMLSHQARSFAEPITWELSGHVSASHRPTPLDAIFPIGTIVTFTATFDSSVPDQCDTPGSGLFLLPGNTVSFGGTTYTSGRNALEVNAPLGSCLATSDRPQDGTVRYLDFVGAPMRGAAVGWIGGPDIGDAMPSQLPNLLGAHFLLAYECSICYAIQGEITSVHVVPEPATLILTAAGVAAIWRRRRDR